MLTGLDRVLFRWQPERIPAHGVQHVETAHPFVASDDISGGVTFGMSDMKTGAARIRKHVEDVEFRLFQIKARLAGVRRVKKLPLIPKALPFGFKPIERVGFAALTHARITRQD